MKKKYYLSSLAAATLLAGCTSDELVPQQSEEVADVLANRPKIEVAFGLENPATRMHAEEGGLEVKFNTSDQLGAVLVDQGLNNPANYWDLVTTNTHIANNKFFYDATVNGGKFVTDGTMCVGSWIFYTPYSKTYTTERGSIKYDLPIVQTYAQDFTELAKKDFRFSPIVNLKGQENGYFDEFTLPTISAYTYANVKLTFPQNVVVQKLVLKPSGQADGTTYAPFAHTYELNYTAGAGMADPTAVADLQNYPQLSPLVTKQDRLDQTKTALKAKTPYLQATQGVPGAAAEQLIALNCLDSNLPASKNFQSYMLIPSGQYTCIRLYAYTNKGVYVYNINDECEAAQTTGTRPAGFPTQDAGSITLKREGVSLHNIGEEASSNADYAAIATKAIKMTETKNNVQLQTSTETDGTVVISQKDLLAVIEGITVAGQMNVRVLGDMVKITSDVAAAIKAAESRVGGDIQVRFDRQVTIEGTEAGYVLNDVTFDGDAKLTTGTISLGSDVNIPTGKNLTVENGATLNVNTLAATVNGYEYSQITNKGTLNANVAGLNIGTVNNEVEGVFTVSKNASITTINNKGDMTVADGVELEAGINNNDLGTAAHKAILTNKGKIHVNSASTNVEEINNYGEIYIENVQLDNSGNITNNAEAKIISGRSGGIGAVIMNTGVITNYGYLYCFNGDNIIKNVGTINAKGESSTTYITTNSANDETTTPTRINTMGVINLDQRNNDVSVTTTTQKGYIVWATTDANIIRKNGDKYNKVVVSGGTVTINDTSVRYIESSCKTLVINTNVIQELKFNTNAELNTTTATVGYLEIAAGKIVKLPTENVIAVENVSDAASSTNADIVNNGTMLVGGNLYSSAITSCPAGTFAAGDGNATAFHWGTGK